MNYFGKMFSDVKGDPSTNRFLSAFVVIFPVLVWAWTVYKAGTWVPIPDEVLWLVGGGLTSKVVQRKIEQTDACDGAAENIKSALKRYLEKGDGN